MQGICTELLRSSPSRAAFVADWTHAIHELEAVDLAQLTRCGRASLMEISERVNQWHLQSTETATKELLAECCRTFVEHCAEIVEMAGVSPKLASTLLGVSIRMAEVVGKTGSLIVAMESEFFEIRDKLAKLELVYDVALKRVETVAGEMATLQSRVDAARETARREQLREQHVQLQKELTFERSDPLSVTVEAASEHLRALLQQAGAPRSMNDTAKILGWTKSLKDPVLAASIRQSASHLQCMLKLLSQTESQTDSKTEGQNSKTDSKTRTQRR